MDKINDGGPAFPLVYEMTLPPPADAVPGKLYIASPPGKVICPGLSVRDYYAAKAMQAAISGHIAHYGHDENYWLPKDIADYANEVAAAMLAARDES